MCVHLAMPLLHLVQLPPFLTIRFNLLFCRAQPGPCSFSWILAVHDASPSSALTQPTPLFCCTPMATPRSPLDSSPVDSKKAIFKHSHLSLMPNFITFLKLSITLQQCKPDQSTTKNIWRQLCENGYEDTSISYNNNRSKALEPGDRARC